MRAQASAVAETQRHIDAMSEHELDDLVTSMLKVRVTIASPRDGIANSRVLAQETEHQITVRSEQELNTPVLSLLKAQTCGCLAHHGEVLA